MDISDEFESFVKRVSIRNLSESFRDGVPAADIEQLVRVYEEEARVGLIALQSADLSNRRRLLEIGSGVGLLSLFLSYLGKDVVSIEPQGQGFDVMHSIRRAYIENFVQEGLGNLPQFIDMKAEDLNEDEMGLFDLAFSINVIEHVDDPSAVLTAIHAVVAQGGVHCHVCPNYFFPYDPHFGVIVLPRLSVLARLFLRGEITQSPLWKSLNFIDYGTIRRWSKRLGVPIEFNPDIFRLAFNRLKEPSCFSSRHGLLARTIGRLSPRVLQVIAAATPIWLQSPLFFRVHVEDDSS